MLTEYILKKMSPSRIGIEEKPMIMAETELLIPRVKFFCTTVISI